MTKGEPSDSGRTSLTVAKLANFDQIVQVRDKEKEKSNSRRAAYNALVRLKENSQRLKMAPEKLRAKLLAEGGPSKVPSDLVTMLVDEGGDIAALQASFQAQEEQEREFCRRQAMVPMTEQQVLKLYGADEGKRVMASKKAMGMTQPDRNNPGKDAYLMFEEKTEVNFANRSRHSFALSEFFPGVLLATDATC